MKKSKIYKENGELKVNITIDTGLSMLEFEKQLEFLLESMKEELSIVEVLQVKHQVLSAYTEAVKKI